MSVPAAGESLPIDVNYRSGVGGVEAEDGERVRNLRIRRNSDRLLVESGPAATSLLPSEILIDESGTGLTFATALKWLAVANDDLTDSVWVRLDSLVGSTVSATSFKVGPQELFDLDVDRIKSGITSISLKTLTGTVATCRVMTGL